MTIYQKTTIGGTTYNDLRNIKVTSKTGESNAASTFTATVDNQDGLYANTFSVGQEIQVFADLDTNPATTNIFTGILEDIQFRGTGASGIKGERLLLRGRDFSARLQDATVQPVIYQNQEASVIVKDIITNNVSDITTTNVNVSSTTVKFLQFTQKNVFDALKELAELAGFIFYVDVDKDLHFEEKATVSTGTTLNNTNVIKTNFKESRKQMANQVWVYGSRQEHGRQDSFTGDGAGSAFVLGVLGHTPTVQVDSVVQVGGVFGQDFSSGVDYLFDQPNKTIAFVSGGSIGYSSIPANNAAIVVDYFFTTPIAKVAKDDASIVAYGPKDSVIVDENITDPSLAKDKAVDELTRRKNPVTQGSLEVNGLPTLIAGQTVVVDMPDEDQSSKTYEILEVEWNFDPKRMFSNNVIKVKIAQKLSDMIDTIKQLIQDVKALQTGDIETADILTRIILSTGSIGLRVNSYYVRTRTLGDSYITNHYDHREVGNIVDWSSAGSAENTLLVGDRRSIQTIVRSGGTFI